MSTEIERLRRENRALQRQLHTVSVERDIAAAEKERLAKRVDALEERFNLKIDETDDSLKPDGLVTKGSGSGVGI